MRVNRQELLDALNKLKPALPSGASLPMLQHFWVDGKTIRAYDGTMGIRVAFNLDFKGGVPGNPMLGLLNGTSVEDARIDNSGSTLKVGLARASAKLSMLSDDQNPWPFPAKVTPDTWSMRLDEELIEALDSVLVVKAKQPTRIEEHGVIFYPAKKGAYIYTTDSISLARGYTKNKLPNGKPLLIPRDFAQQVAEQCQPGVELQIKSDTTIVAKQGDLWICSTLMAGQDVLDLNAIVEPYFENNEPVPIPERLVAALKRSQILARSGEMPLVRLTADKGELALFAKYPIGEFSETIEADEGFVGEATVRSDLLLKLLPRADTIAISDRDALVLRGEAGLVYVLISAVGQ